MGYITFIVTFGIAILAAIFAIFSLDSAAVWKFATTFNFNKHEISAELSVARSWEKIIKKPEHEFKRIAVGVNGNVDLIVKGTELLMLLDSSSNSSNEMHIDHPSLRSIKDLQQTFAFYHAKGAGGERYMESSEDFQRVLKTATSIADTEFFIGGNAALMAQKLASMMPRDGKVLIGCPVGPVLKPLFHPSMQITESSLIEQDEYHMILEYSKGESWNGRRCPIASRFIFSHDVSNSKMMALEGFMKGLVKFQPDLVVLSGFHLLEANEKSFWEKRISEIALLLKQLSRNVPIHVELASMTNKMCIKEIMEQIFPLVDSVGLNEQELWMVCQVAGGPHCISAELHGPPAIPKAADVVEWMLRTYSGVPGSRLTRVHFHTLPYHIAAIVESSRWRNQASAVLAGTRIASNQACDDAAYDHPEMVELRVSGRIHLSAIDRGKNSESDDYSRQFNPENPVVSWEKSGISMHLSPVLVCREPGKTVGLGDAISATGLLYSGFLSL